MRTDLSRFGIACGLLLLLLAVPRPWAAMSVGGVLVRVVSSGVVASSTGAKSVVPASAKRRMPARTASSSPTIETPAGPSTPSRSITPLYDGSSS